MNTYKANTVFFRSMQAKKTPSVGYAARYKVVWCLFSVNTVLQSSVYFGQDVADAQR